MSDITHGTRGLTKTFISCNVDLTATLAGCLARKLLNRKGGWQLGGYASTRALN